MKNLKVADGDRPVPEGGNPRINWVNLLFLTATPLLALIGIPLYLAAHPFSGMNLLFLVLFYVATGLSITAGYHRLFAHRSYESGTLVRLFFLTFGAAAFQNSALKWSADHRLHHRFVDSLKDPYSIQKGFFYAHIGWIFFKDDVYDFEPLKDISSDPLVRWQHRFYFPIAVIAGLIFPMGAGWVIGDTWGGLLWGGIVRIVLVHHSTFLINSLSHYIGRQPYSVENSSRDNFFTAFLTFGEGYHNYHHQFQFDYRNGIHWYQWDPTKWIIKTLELVRCAKKLRKASDASIFKARVLVQREQLDRNLRRFSFKVPAGFEQKLNAAQEKLLIARTRWTELKKEYRELKSSMDHRRIELTDKLKHDLQAAKKQMEEALQIWNALLRELYRLHQESYLYS